LYFIFNCGEVNVQLTNDDYRGTEEEGSIEIVIIKDTRIATNVRLTVTPVAFSEARRLNMFPMNVEIPDDNGGHSPVEAGENILHASVGN
jgi:hypothetical protein